MAKLGLVGLLGHKLFPNFEWLTAAYCTGARNQPVYNENQCKSWGEALAAD